MLNAVLHEEIETSTQPQGIAQRVAQLVTMCGHSPGTFYHLVDLLQVHTLFIARSIHQTSVIVLNI